jgi:hypothetical protein
MAIWLAFGGNWEDNLRCETKIAPVVYETRIGRMEKLI